MVLVDARCMKPGAIQGADMTNTTHAIPTPRVSAPRRPAWAWALLAATTWCAVSTLSACGGGSDTPPATNPGSGTAGSPSAGTGGTSGSTSGGGTAGSTSGTGSTVGTGSTSTPSTGGTVYGTLQGASLGVGASLNGAVPFPASNAWNQDISQAPLDPNSARLIQSIGLNTSLHADFGAGLYEGRPMGIPYVVVSGQQARVPIHFTMFGDESDPGPYPIPLDAPIEGGPSSDGDRHVLVIDRDNNRLYEVGYAYRNNAGGWDAGGGAIFHLDSNTVRPGGQPGWTSADAAGLPIFPGLVRYDEASQGPGGIRHALRFTVVNSRQAYVPPATHWASTKTSVDLPPMGMRVRLKASYAIPASFSKESRAILQAMKTYGMIVADNGSNWFVSGAPDDRWDNDRLSAELSSVKGEQFEVIRMDGLKTP